MLLLRSLQSWQVALPRARSSSIPTYLHVPRYPTVLATCTLLVPLTLGHTHAFTIPVFLSAHPDMRCHGSYQKCRDPHMRGTGTPLLVSAMRGVGTGRRFFTRDVHVHIKLHVQSHNPRDKSFRRRRRFVCLSPVS